MPEAAHETKRSAAVPSLQNRPADASIGDNREREHVVMSRPSPERSFSPSMQVQQVSNLGVALHPSFTLHAFWRRALRGVIAAIVLIPVASACSGPARESGPLFGSGVFHPPPKPGDSISHSQMCACKTCNPSACCDGPEDDAPPTSCGDSYDFSSNPSCGGLAVKSCSSRCTQQVWRVQSGRDCAEKRPSSCCQAG